MLLSLKLALGSEKTVFDRIIGINWVLAYFIGAEKVRKSSLTSQIRLKLWK